MGLILFLTAFTLVCLLTFAHRLRNALDTRDEDGNIVVATYIIGILLILFAAIRTFADLLGD